MSNKVFIAASIDGYIADKEGNIDWLQATPNPDNDDMGYSKFMDSVDAIIMGKKTFESICGFDIDWPYAMPVYVLSTSLKSVPKNCGNQVFIVNGHLTDILSSIDKQGAKNLYIDGGKTIQSFLKEDLIEEMIITTIPVLLGGGTPLFQELPNPLNFKCVESKIFLNQVVQHRYIRNRN